MKNNINCYKCKTKLIPGKSYAIVCKIARRIFNNIASKTKRRPYIRSSFFDGEKIFLDNFWSHLMQKNASDRKRRLRFFECGVELIEFSKIEPIYESKDHILNEAYYRFFR